MLLLPCHPSGRNAGKMSGGAKGTERNPSPSSTESANGVGMCKGSKQVIVQGEPKN